MEGYFYVYKGLSNATNFPTEIYTFKAHLVNQTYIAEVQRLDNHIYVIKFFLKNHRLSSLRFNSLLKEGNNRHTFYVLNTLVNISLDIIKKDDMASFGFMGAAVRKESSRKTNAININPDNTIRNTKRFRTYSLYVKRYFPPNKFDHIEFENSSSYLLKNINNHSLTSEMVNDYLNDLIVNLNT